MTAILLLHGVVAAVVLAVGGRRARRSFLVAAVAPAVTVAWAATQWAAATRGTVVRQSLAWVPGLDLNVDLRLDGFAFVMVLLVSVVGTLVFTYSGWYLDDRDGLGRFAATLVLFAGAMQGLVLADDLLTLYVFWELTSVTSYLLIGFEDEKATARGAALQAILVTGAGGLVMLGGFVLLGQQAGTTSLSALLADPPSGTATTVALALVLVGAITKSAQVPFHFWLPAAMAAPTPVSAYLHSATMVKAGVYLIARLAPAFAVAAVWRPAVVVLGLTTMLVGGYRALRQHDLKLLLAYGTVSQLGLLVVLFGIGTEATTKAAMVLLLAHAVFKAALFLVVGIIDHHEHTRDLRRLDGLGRRMPALFAIAALAAASMAGLPPFLGFVAKEAVYESLLHVGAAWGPAVIAGVVAGSALTVAYSARFLWGAFATGPVRPVAGAVAPHPAPVAAALTGPPAALAAAGLVLGAAVGLLDPLVSAAVGALVREPVTVSLTLWHGINTALGLSVLTVTIGLGLFLGRATVEGAQARLTGWPDAAAAYRATISGLNRTADRVTGTLQNGSLPFYLGAILLTLVLGPGIALALAWSPPVDLVLADSPLQFLAGAAIVISAVATALARRRLVAVLLLGSVGYGVAVLFLVQGAPDLALTQLLVETLAMVIFLLVLRHLPDRFESSGSSWGRGVRLAIASGVGVFVTCASLLMTSARVADPVSLEQLDRALPEAGGRNVVNVILVDFRGWDTFGEITVIVVAALGIWTLVRPSSGSRRSP